MSLGERIYKLRTEKEMSQGDLADALEVSRQSISKWETNGSVPELDKLIKLSEVFGVSLDELILDKKQTEQPSAPEAPEQKVIYVERQATTSTQKAAGVVLLCFAGLIWLFIALLGDVISGLVLAAPFVGCSMICMFVKKNPGIWCFWVVYLFVDIYLRFETGVHWQYILSLPVYNVAWTIHLIAAWILFITFVTLSIVTALRSRKEKPGTLRSNVIICVSSLAIYFISWFLFALPAYEAENAAVYPQSHRYFAAVSGWARNVVLAVALVFLLRWIAALVAKRKNHQRAT